LPVCRISGLLLCWFAGLLVCRIAGLLVCWFAGLLVCRIAGLPDCWFAGYLTAIRFLEMHLCRIFSTLVKPHEYKFDKSETTLHHS
jgi:hypothetical protein